jgi:hypothetical protein
MLIILHLFLTAVKPSVFVLEEIGAYCKHWTGLWTMDYIWTMDYGLWTVDCGLWTLVFRF